MYHSNLFRIRNKWAENIQRKSANTRLERKFPSAGCLRLTVNFFIQSYITRFLQLLSHIDKTVKNIVISFIHTCGLLFQ